MTPENWPLYHYKLIEAIAVDGDTVRGRIDLGLGALLKVDLRLIGINAPEVVGADKAAGLAAKADLEAVLGSHGRLLYIRTHKDQRSFARYLAEAWILQGEVLVPLAVFLGFNVMEVPA